MTDGAAEQSAFLALLADHAAAGTLTLYVGGGVSAPAPSSVPDSVGVVTGVAETIRARLGLEVRGPDGQKALEVIGSEAEATGPDTLLALKSILADFAPFRRNTPGESHHLLAIIAREGIAQVLSINWDVYVEEAATVLGFRLVPTVSGEDRRSMRPTPPMHKVHGCVSRYGSLMVTTAEIETPDAWALADIDRAIASGPVVFLGMGTLPMTLKVKLKSIVEVDDIAVYVVKRTLSDDWREVLGGHLGRHRPGVATDFLRDLASAVVRRIAASLIDMADRLASDDPASDSYKASARQLADALIAVPAANVLVWLRDGASSIPIGTRFATEPPAVSALVAVARLAGRALSVRPYGASLVVEAPDVYVRIVAGNGEIGMTLARNELERTRRIRQSGGLPDVTVPVVHVAVGHVGPLPAPFTEADLVASGSPGSIVDGDAGPRDSWVSAATYLENVAVA